MRETAKEIITKCKEFIRPFITVCLCGMLKCFGIKNAQTQTTLMNTKNSRKLLAKPMNKTKTFVYSFRKQSVQQQKHDRVWS